MPSSGMGLPMDDDVVAIHKGKTHGEPCIVTVNCPDKTGLACDVCRIILEFGLFITKGDISTDGIWCYIVLWVVPHYKSVSVSWPRLKERIQSVCPSSSPVSFYLNQQPPTSDHQLYLLKFCCLDRKGLLNDVTQVLCELELTIQKVKVTTTPDGEVLNLFFITDNMDMLHTKERQDETCERLHAVLRESCMSCELQLAGPEFEYNQAISSFTSILAEELFRCELSDKEVHSQALSPDMTKLKEANVIVDNTLSPAHTLLQINCADHKGLLYDIMRTLKDSSMKMSKFATQFTTRLITSLQPFLLSFNRFLLQISYGRFSPNHKGCRDLDLFVQQKDGKKIVDPEKQNSLSSRLKIEMLHPLRVIISNRGPDTELLVANPVELSGKGRPRVFYDVTLALKKLGICIFSADIGRLSSSGREWEVYRFLLDENCSFQLSNASCRIQIVDKVRRTLMGW